MTVRSKFSEKEHKPIKPETIVTKNTCNIPCKTDKDSDANKVGPFDNKENISINIEKDNASNRDSSSTDDVVIVSVTENNSVSDNIFYPVIFFKFHISKMILLLYVSDFIFSY